jgi:hypothetical protein
MNTITKTLAEILPAGDTYQNGIKPGPTKLAQFKAALKARQTPPLYSQEDQGMNVIATVKLFDPCGRWTWFITEWDGNDCAFGYVSGHCGELGYIDLQNLANTKGRLGIGIEIDMHWTPQALWQCVRQV